MSYRKKHKSSKAGPVSQQAITPEVKYANPGVSRDLSTAKLTSGQPYQRPVEPEDVDRLIAKWDDRLLTPIVVSFRDGNFNVVDGQHRIAAMRKMAGGGDVIIPCIIYTDLTYEQEAELYYMLDRTRGKLRLAHATKALVESGADAAIIDVKRRVEDAGFVWALDKPTGEAFEIATTRAVINAYRLLGGEAFSRMLGLPERGLERLSRLLPLSFPEWRCFLKPTRRSWWTRFLSSGCPRLTRKKSYGGARWTFPPTKPPCDMPVSFSASTTASSVEAVSSPTASRVDTSLHTTPQTGTGLRRFAVRS